MTRPWPDPTPEMVDSPEFEAVWQCIKDWDINVPDVGYWHGATGNHVRAILDALREATEKPRDLTVTRVDKLRADVERNANLLIAHVDEHGVAYNIAGESIGTTGTTGDECSGAVGEQHREKKMHPFTYEFQMPTNEQKALMAEARKAALEYANLLDRVIPEGPDKTFVIRQLRTVAMWVNVAITRHPDGSPR